jgi:hypothetical protein
MPQPGALATLRKRLPENACQEADQDVGQHPFLLLMPDRTRPEVAFVDANRIKNSSAGFDPNGSFSFAIRRTRYENCPNAVNDRRRDMALLPGDATPLTPAAPAGPVTKQARKLFTQGTTTSATSSSSRSLISR